MINTLVNYTTENDNARCVVQMADMISQSTDHSACG